MQDELPYVTTGYTVLMRTYEARVLRTCRRLLGNPQDADDVYQEVLIRVFHGIGKFKLDASFNTWLFRITHNECMTRLRARAREQRLFVSDGGQVQPVAAPEQTELTELGRDIDRVLAQMSFSDREVLALRFVSGLAIADIAQLTGITLSATKMRLSRASARFIALLNTETKASHIHQACGETSE